jgi:type IV secretory pathway VirB4 component
VAFLVRLHALLIGDHDAGADSYGLDALQRSLLAHAIRQTYRRAAATATTPRESLLRDVLYELAAAEQDRSPDHASVLRDLAINVADLCQDGTYGYLFDRPTSIPAAREAPLIVFNTAKVPEDVSAAVLFSVFEYITNRVERRWRDQLQRRAAGHTPAGPLDGTSILVFEEVWKVVSRRATAEFVTERARRGRHSGLWTIALSQARRDLDSPHARALLDNATLHLLLGQSRDDLHAVADAIGLSSEEVTRVSQLVTEKGA